jgi:hypothetical protein
VLEGCILGRDPAEAIAVAAAVLRSRAHARLQEDDRFVAVKLEEAARWGRAASYEGAMQRYLRSCTATGDSSWRPIA